MPSHPKEYEPLPGSGTRRGSFIQVKAVVSRLWLGKDHLLLVDSNGFVESYKRFYFRDIQGFTITRTRRRVTVNAFLLTLTLVFGGLAFFNTGAVSVAFTSLAALPAFGALVNTLRGPSCICLIATAAQTDELASLRRIGRARRVLARLNPLITAAQAPQTEASQNPGPP